MSGYDVVHFLQDFADRTKQNQELIDNLAKRKDTVVSKQDNEAARKDILKKHIRTKDIAYEVTQLINSLLGLIVIPYESYRNSAGDLNDDKFKKLSPVDFDNVKAILKACDAENRLFDDYNKAEERDSDGVICLNSFIQHLRNAIAHGGSRGINFYPLSESGEKISGVIFYDFDFYDKSANQGQFCIKLKIDELRRIVYAIANLYCEHEKNKNIEAGSIRSDHYARIEELKNLMKYKQSENKQEVINLMKRRSNT